MKPFPQRHTPQPKAAWTRTPAGRAHLAAGQRKRDNHTADLQDAKLARQRRSIAARRAKAAAKPSKRVNPVSARKREEDRLYRPLRNAFIALHPKCECCFGCVDKADDVHHPNGELGVLRFYFPWFKAVSRRHHDWIHAHPDEARERGLLCAKGLWNAMPPGKWQVMAVDNFIGMPAPLYGGTLATSPEIQIDEAWAAKATALLDEARRQRDGGADGK